MNGQESKSGGIGDTVLPDRQVFELSVPYDAVSARALGGMLTGAGLANALGGTEAPDATR